MKISQLKIIANFSYFFFLSFVNNNKKTAIIVSVYEDPIQPQQAATAVEKLGDYLISCGY